MSLVHYCVQAWSPYYVTSTLLCTSVVTLLCHLYTTVYKRGHLIMSPLHYCEQAWSPYYVTCTLLCTSVVTLLCHLYTIVNKRGHLIMLNISYCPRKCSIEKLNWICGFFLYEGSLTRRKCARDSFVVGAKRPAVVMKVYSSHAAVVIVSVQ